MEVKSNMSRHKLKGAMLLAVAAAMLLSAVGASSASAELVLSAENCNGTVTWLAVCWAPTETVASLAETKELEGSVEVVASGGPNLFVVPGIPVEIECGSVKQFEKTGKLNQTTPLTVETSITGQLTFEGCKLVGTNAVATKCVIPVKETTKALKGHATAPLAVLLKPTEGEVFIEITFTSKEGQTCPATVIGKRKVTGAEELKVAGTELKGTLGSKSATSVVKSELLFIEKQAELTGEISVTIPAAEDWLYIATP
jgi:hypothetical protein